MRNTILGAVGGLVLGTVGALAFSYFTNDALIADLQAKLDAAKAALDRANKEKSDLASENTGLNDQVDRLKKDKPEAATASDDAAKPAMPKINPMNLMGLVAGAMRGMQTGPARIFLLKTRLHLKPDQEAALKAAMDADDKARRDLFMEARQNNQRPDMAAIAAINSTDKVMASTLDPEQQRQYTQLQTDEKNARADTAATTQVDTMAPLLQLSDSQREQVYNALYQTQLNAPSGMTMMGNPQSVFNQTQSVNDALAKVLTADQISAYNQEGDIMAQNPGFGGGGGGGGQRRNRDNGNNGGGGNGGGGGGGNTANPAPAPPSNGASAVSPTPGYAAMPGTTTTGYGADGKMVSYTTTVMVPTNSPTGMAAYNAQYGATTNSVPALANGQVPALTTNAAPAAASQ